MMPRLLPGRIVIITKWFVRPQEGDVVMIYHDGLEKIKRITKVDGPKIFVSGENRLASTDSRDFGWLDIGTVKAKLLWPRS